MSQNKSSIPINITNPSTSSTQNTTNSVKNVLFHELQLTINSAKFTNKEELITLSPDIYVELNVDDNLVHKTECINSTFNPKWDTEFPILITPYSKLTFKCYHKTNLTKDILLGEISIYLYDILKKYNGKIDNLSKPLILDKINDFNQIDDLSTSINFLNLEDKERKKNENLILNLIDFNKPNYLFIKLHGLEIDNFLVQYPPKNSRSVSPNTQVLSSSANANVDSSYDKNLSSNSSSSNTNKTKSNQEKHSTRSLPRLFRGSKNQSNNNSNNNSNSNSSQAINNSSSPSFLNSTDHTQADGLSNNSNNFQTLSTLPRWSLNDPNLVANSSSPTNLNNSPYPRQPPLNLKPTPAVAAAVHYPIQSYPIQSPINQAQTSFSITNNTNQIQPATITTTEFHEELPPGWEVRFDCFGRKYYVDHNTKSTTWELPLQEALPAGWEIRRDTRGRVYYVDHNTRTTTWQRPTAEAMRNYQHWQRQQGQVMQQCDQRFLYPTQSNNNNNSTNSSNPTMQYQVLTQQHLNPAQQQLNPHLNKNLVPTTTNQVSGAASSSLADNQINEHSEAPLPENWERRFDNNGRQYFVNHKNKTTQWQDPRTQGEEIIEAPLPPGFEMKLAPDGTKYFVDHNTKTTTLQDPRLIGPKGAYGVTTNNERSFRHKLTQFRYLCHFNALHSHIKITVSRNNIFEDSFHQILRVPPHELRRRLFITFRGEEGLDYGGISREWFFLLSHEFLNPMYCLFEYAGKNNYSLQINPASSVNPDHLLYFKFIGRVAATSLFHGKFIYSGFTLPFYKRMLGKKLVMKDIESIDPEFYNSLVWIKENNIEECGLELYFSVDFEVLGKLNSYELKENGSEIRVTESNKHEYLILMSDWRFSRGQEEQTKAFLDGFNEVLPLEWLKYFDERELELLLCGMQEVDVDDWQRNTIYRHYTRNSKQIQWFWQFVKEVDNEKRARLLQFVTGTCRVPVGGFAELMGSNGPQRFCIERVGKDNWLPRSHTCFNRLDLPPYKNYEQLVEKLSFAIEETESFGQE